MLAIRILILFLVATSQGHASEKTIIKLFRDPLLMQGFHRIHSSHLDTPKIHVTILNPSVSLEIFDLSKILFLTPDERAWQLAITLLDHLKNHLHLDNHPTTKKFCNTFGIGVSPENMLSISYGKSLKSIHRRRILLVLYSQTSSHYC